MIVIKDFEHEDKRYLKMSVGEKIICFLQNGEWSLGMNTKEQKGFFPTSFC